jgi:VWFA-related protein
VVDARGEAVLGLGPEDFKVKVDGKPVAVESALWVGPSEDEDVVVTPDGTSPPPARAALPEPRLVVFLFQKDLDRSRIGGLLRMLEKLDSLLAVLGPGDLAAALVFDSHLRLVHDFSANHGRLRRALEQDLFRGRVAVQESDEPSLLAHLDARDAKRAASPERALQVIGEGLLPLAGPKTLVLFGWGLGQFSRMGVHMTPDYDPARRVLQKARCSVFSLDVTDADYHSLEVGLEQVAEDTGGFYAKTHLFPDQALKRMERALQGYYVLSFERPEGKPGMQRLEVGLDGKKGNVLAPSAVG